MIMSAQEARGPMIHERAWRPALRKNMSGPSTYALRVFCHSTCRTSGGKRFDWRGVDKFRLRDGRIVEERVYMDTAPLRAAAEGLTLRPVIAL